MITFNNNFAFIVFCALAGSSSIIKLFTDSLASDTEPSRDEQVEAVMQILAFSLAIAFVAGIAKGERNEQIEEGNEEDNDNDEVDEETNLEVNGPLLYLNNAYEQRLIDCGYDLNLLEIPNGLCDPVSSSIMESPVILLTLDACHRQTVDYTTYKYLVAARNSECPFSGEKITGYIPDEHLKLLIEAWVIGAELAAKGVPQSEQESEMHKEMLKLDYYRMLFSHKARKNEGDSLDVNEVATLSL